MKEYKYEKVVEGEYSNLIIGIGILFFFSILFGTADYSELTLTRGILIGIIIGISFSFGCSFIISYLFSRKVHYRRIRV